MTVYSLEDCTGLTWDFEYGVFFRVLTTATVKNCYTEWLYRRYWDLSSLEAEAQDEGQQGKF